MNIRSVLIITVLLIACHTAAYAQQTLTNSRQSSYYTYIYKLYDGEVEWFYRQPGREPPEKILHTVVDSFKTDSNWKNRLPPGNYLKIYALKNRLQYQLIENNTLTLHLLNNNNDLNFTLTDRQGNPVTDAKTTADERDVTYDAQSASYHANYPKNNVLLKVGYAGITNFFLVRTPRSFKRNFLSKNWIKYEKNRIAALFRNKRYDHGYQIRSNNDITKYTGFLVFNKPKYKPRDTVKFKAYILNKKSNRPVADKELIVRLKEDYDDNGRVLGSIKSYREGAFEYQFVLADSLELRLDEDYTISLEDPSSLKYNLDNYKGDDQQQFLAKREVLILGNFKYEDYELKTIKLNTRTDKTTQGPGEPVSLYLKAVDENDLQVPDGRVTIILKTQQASNYKASAVFIPDTLWQHEITLDPVGETKVMIPDSIFPKADVDYMIVSNFLNADNERQFATNSISFKYNKYKIEANLYADTLKALYYVLGKQRGAKAFLCGINSTNDTVTRTSVQLPFAIRINPNLKGYFIKTDSAMYTFDLANSEGGLSFSSYRTADSVFVKVINPRKISFSYCFFDGSRLIDKGSAHDTLLYKTKFGADGKAGFLINYVWGGNSRFRANSIPYQDKLLNIEVKQPFSVYPGQQVKTEITVKDFKGNPVANTDVTAWSLTKKFEEYTAPYIPYLGKSYYFRTKPDLLSNKLHYTGAMQLDWEGMSRTMGLDSIAYYKFTHPKSIFAIEEPVSDTLTQIAPFLVRDGDIVPVHILYIDGRPVYFNQAEQLQRYSFSTAPGVHKLTFRTLNKSIELRDVNVEKNKKLIVSFNLADSLNTSASFIKAPDTLTRYEADLLNKYMIKVFNNFGWRMATLEQNNDILLLNPHPHYQNQYDDILAGPLASNIADLKVRNLFAAQFLTEPGYSFQFTPGFLKQKSIGTRYPFNTHLLKTNNPFEDYNQRPLTRQETDSLWQQYLDLRSNTTPLFRNEATTDKNTGYLEVKIKPDKNGENPFVKNIIIYRDDDPDYIRVYPGIQTALGYLNEGSYRILFLFKGDRYAIWDSIRVKKFGRNVYSRPLQPLPKDSVSIKINSVIQGRNGLNDRSDNEINNDALKLKEAFNDKYLNPGNFKDMMFGRVVAKDDKLPIPGVTVVVKGTNLGTQTDMNGRFQLKVPTYGKLILHFIGYQGKEINIEPGRLIDVVLAPDFNELREVVITGYGSQRRMDLTSSVSTVNALAMGMGITNGGVNSKDIFLRGINTVAPGSTPLIVVDGILMDSMANIDPSLIQEISILKNNAAAAIYGIAGSNGVIVISTKKKAGVALSNETEQGSQQQSLRKNFNDYAYWQPRLTTDENGKASFITTFPDDITNWRTLVIGINGQGQSGFAEGQIKSFKPVSANFISPQFALEGDQIKVIGKVLNYNIDPVSVNRTFSYNGKMLKQDALIIKNSRIDTLAITAEGKDSLTFEYTIHRDNGYFDGERRKIPVLEQGTLETKGIFEALNNDTTLNLKFDPALGPVKFTAEASLLPVLKEEAERLRNYRYLCNEQLASKLKGLLAEKHIDAYLKEPFKWDKNVRELISKLQENRKTQGTWGWWKDTDDELWISLHAVEALIQAHQLGYQTQLDEGKLTDYLIYQLDSYQGGEKLACLQLLKELGAKADYQHDVAVIAKEMKTQGDTSKYDQFRLLLLRQEAGLPVNADSLLTLAKHTLFGNIYWGEASYRFFDNSIQLTVLAYHILKTDGRHPEQLAKIRGYFLEQRRNDNWRNTYESSLILETILPDVLTNDKTVKPSLLTLGGGVNATVDKFPYTSTFSNEQLSVSKTGTLPVYITGYQQFWNTHPEKTSKDFAVNTHFEKKGEVITKLKGGEPATLKAEVTAKGDADFVMIEIPIPAGCSYESKEQPYNGIEVHREYFKDRVSIFCRKLKQGTYTFTLSLLPRFDGLYTLNPARAEMMYFPVFYGREGMKKVVIGE